MKRWNISDINTDLTIKAELYFSACVCVVFPVLEEQVFLNKYEETQNGSVSGSGMIDMAGVNMKAQGRGTAKILSSLGTLRKERLIMPHFLKDSKDR